MVPVGHQFWMSCVYELMLRDGIEVLASEVLKYQKIRCATHLSTVNHAVEACRR